MTCLPDNWEDINPDKMPLPRSKKDSDTEEDLFYSCCCKPSKGEQAKKKSGKKRKRKRARRRSAPSSTLLRVLRQQDCIVERTPVFTRHAKQRLQEGRSGEFVTKKKGNAVIVVTVLPSFGRPRKGMQSIRRNRKQGQTKYKVR